MNKLTLKIKQLLLLFFCIAMLFSCKKEIKENMDDSSIEKPLQITEGIKALIKEKLTTSDYDNIKWSNTVITKVINTEFKVIKIAFNTVNDNNSREAAFISLDNKDDFFKGQIIKIKAKTFDSLGQINGTYYEANIDRSNEQYFDIVGGMEINNSNTSNLSSMYYPRVIISLAAWYNLLDALGIGGMYYGIDHPPLTGGGSGGGGSSVPTYTYNSLYLANLLQLTTVERDWLNTHISEAQDIYDAIDESRNIDAGCEGDLLPVGYTPYEAIQASKITIAAAMAGQINGNYNVNHFNNYVSPNLTSAQTNIIIVPNYLVNFLIECAEIRQDHPEWSNAKIYWHATVELIHNALDVAGMIPGAGEVADLANGVIYTVQGDGINAAFSYAAAIPIYGWASTSAKWAKKTIIALNGTKKTLKWFKQANGLITFGNRNLLRKVLGLAVGDLRQAHHLIPWEHGSHSLVQKAAGADFHLNEILNGIPLNAIQHSSGGHTLYNEKVRIKLQALWDVGGNTGSADLAKILVRNLGNNIRSWILAHPNQSINDIIL